MFFRIVTILSLAVFASSAFAALDGKWSGKATVTQDDGTSEEGIIRVTLANDGAGNLVFEHDYLHAIRAFKLSGEDVFYDGTLVGKWTVDAFTVSFANPNDSTCTFNYSLNTAGKYVDNYTCTDGFFIRYDGALTRSDGMSQLICH